ncbi:saccharopine dehydrogenase [Kribbella sp. C-35]|uniref:saccharopine dehydrogenase n=1 Tax=Kribbella sp. C-35 TaxID=2789276 RepID=UPI00397D6F14
MDSVLMLGGSGQAGASTAAMLRQWHPDLPLTIAGRDLGRARRVADDLGTSAAVSVDLSRQGLGLPDGSRHSAVVATVWDKHLLGLQYAQDRGVPYVSISSGLSDIAPEVVAGGQRPTAAPVLVASHWAAGVVVHLARYAAREFDRVDTVEIGAVLDEMDAGGPASAADLERWADAASTAMIRQDGVFRWTADVAVDVPAADGVVLPGQLAGILDVPSVAVATGAANVRFGFAMGVSSGRRAGGEPSHDIRIRLGGTGRSGAPLERTMHLVHPGGQRPVTAVGIALGLERLITRQGDLVAPGIHMPEGLVDPEYAVRRLLGSGATLAHQPIG